MKTKLNKRSLAAVLAAVVLSSGAIMGISLSLSQKADAQMYPCWLTIDDEVVMACEASLIYTCEVKMPGTAINPETGETIVTEVVFHCSGKNVVDEFKDWVITEPVPNQ